MGPDKKASTKLVKVDNWGIFFLQRLQLMFAKGDLCDLTLKFQDDQELKVHRLVLNTCTKYFGDDESPVHKMPESLSYSSMLPIVNFMYSGRLEFKPEMHDSILATAQTLNMSILIQLLMTQKNERILMKNKEDHRKALEAKFGPIGDKKLPFWNKRAFPFYAYHKRTKVLTDDNPAPTRVEWPCADTSTLMINSPSFSSISYESEPVMTSQVQKQDEEADRSRGRKRRVAPPPSVSQKQNKRLGESQIIMGSLSDDDDDCHFESLHTFEESDDEVIETISREKTPKPILKSPPIEPTTTITTPQSAKRVRFCLEDKENAPDKPFTEEVETEKSPPHPSFTEIATAVTDIVNTPKEQQKPEGPNHAKIIAEVLRKFPDLVKNNKNIKLKITTPSGSGSKSVNMDSSTKANAPAKASYVVVKPSNKVYDKSAEEEDFSLFTDNAAGPWICKKCIVSDDSTKFENYQDYHKHLLNTHTEKVDAKVCEFCGYKASRRNVQLYHLLTKHNVIPPKNVKFPKCELCKFVALNESMLSKHSLTHQTCKELVCNICKLSFKSSSSFQAHCVTCKPSNEVRNYSCKNCNKQFRTNVSLKAHYKDCIVACADNSTTITLAPSMEPVEMIEMPLIEAVPENKDALVQLPPGIIVTDNSNVSLIHDEGGTLTNVTDGMPASIGFTVLPEDHQTVILLDDNSDFFLQGNSSVVVASENSEDYIVPEILPDNVTRLYTSGNISYAMNATSVITYPVVQVPSSLPDSNSSQLTAIPVSQAGNLFITDKEITIASEVTSMGDQTKLEMDMASHQLRFVESQLSPLKQNHSAQEEILSSTQSEGGIIIPVEDSPDKVKDISTEWDFENEEEEEQGEVGEDPDKRPSRPSIELNDLL